MENGYITINELKCKCGCKTHEQIDLRANLIVLDAVLEIIRSHVGQAVNINSGVRCKEHNKKVGGKQASYHLRGMAADIRVKGYTGNKLYKWLEEKVKTSQLPVLKLIEYKNFVHLDIRYLIKKGGI